MWEQLLQGKPEDKCWPLSTLYHKYTVAGIANLEEQLLEACQRAKRKFGSRILPVRMAEAVWSFFFFCCIWGITCSLITLVSPLKSKPLRGMKWMDG